MNKGNLAMTIFEGSVAKDVGKMLCTSCHTLEDDSSLALTTTDIFKSIDWFCSDEFDMPSLKKAAHDASIKLKEILAPMLHHQHVLQNNILDKISEVHLMQSEINLIRADVDATTKKTSGRRRVSRRTNVSVENDRVKLLK